MAKKKELQYESWIQGHDGGGRGVDTYAKELADGTFVAEIHQVGTHVLVDSLECENFDDARGWAAQAFQCGNF